MLIGVFLPLMNWTLHVTPGNYMTGVNFALDFNLLKAYVYDDQKIKRLRNYLIWIHRRCI